MALIADAKVYAPDGDRVEQECAGPTWAGACPKVPPGEAVACAGRKLVVRLQDGGEVVLNVAEHAVSCPLAAFALAVDP